MEVMFWLRTYSLVLSIVFGICLFNWLTTCCCGHTMILEFLEGTCEPHDDDIQHAAGHPDDQRESCHKCGVESFLSAGGPAASDEAVASLIHQDAGSPAEIPYSNADLSFHPQSRGMSRQYKPPDVLLRSRRLLI
jgi:hypothetical protein